MKPSTLALSGGLGASNIWNMNAVADRVIRRDPMIGVEFRDGKKEEFWKDELKSCGMRLAKPVDAVTKKIKKT